MRRRSSLVLLLLMQWGRVKIGKEGGGKRARNLSLYRVFQKEHTSRGHETVGVEIESAERFREIL